MLVSVVDDDESVRDATESLLRSVGYKVAKFESGERFLASEAISDTQCLILDIRMPGIDGFELQRRMHISDVDIPIIFVTAHGDNNNRKQAMDAGASGFFQKPFAANDFLAAVRTALEGPPDR